MNFLDSDDFVCSFVEQYEVEGAQLPPVGTCDKERMASRYIGGTMWDHAGVPVSCAYTSKSYCFRLFPVIPTNTVAHWLVGSHYWMMPRSIPVLLQGDEPTREWKKGTGYECSVSVSLRWCQTRPRRFDGDS